MKGKILLLMVFICAGLHVKNALAQPPAAALPGTPKAESGEKLRLTIRPSDEVYHLGEPVNISFSLINTSDKPISFPDAFGVGTGFLHLEASRDGKNFEGCDDPNWGLLDIDAKTTIRPGASVETSASILWGRAGQNAPVFRFTEPGSYYIKAHYTVRIDGQEAAVKLESEPVKIDLRQPEGEDLEVWNKIKEDGFYAYFILRGDLLIPEYKLTEREKFLREVERLLIDHPGSFHAASLRRSLDKFRALEKRLEETRRKIKSQNQN